MEDAGQLQARFREGMALHRRNDLDGAERIYRDILKRLPAHFDATHMLGVVLLQRHRTKEGIALIRQAITLGWQTPAWCPFMYLGMLGLGFGGMLVTTMLALISFVDHADHALVTSASFAFRAVGSSAGITVASVIFQNSLIQELRKRLGQSDDIDRLIERIRRNFDAVWHLEPDVRAEVEAGYMESLYYVFIAILAMSTISWICSLFMKQNKLYNNLARR